jgi:hypothetical protein
VSLLTAPELLDGKSDGKSDGIPEHQMNFLREHREVCQRVQLEKVLREQEAKKLQKQQADAQRLARESAAAERTRERGSSEGAYEETADLVKKLYGQVLELTRPEPRVHIEPLSPTQRLARLSAAAVVASH